MTDTTMEQAPPQNEESPTPAAAETPANAPSPVEDQVPTSDENQASEPTSEVTTEQVDDQPEKSTFQSRMAKVKEAWIDNNLKLKELLENKKATAEEIFEEFMNQESAENAVALVKTMYDSLGPVAKFTKDEFDKWLQEGAKNTDVLKLIDAIIQGAGLREQGSRSRGAKESENTMSGDEYLSWVSDNPQVAATKLLEVMDDGSVGWKSNSIRELLIKAKGANSQEAARILQAVIVGQSENYPIKDGSVFIDFLKSDRNGEAWEIISKKLGPKNLGTDVKDKIIDLSKYRQSQTRFFGV